MLRVAMPNKGALAESAAEMMREAGYRGRRESKELVVVDQDNDVELFFLRPRDIALYVGSGTLEVGITGRDLLLDSGAEAREVLQLGFGASTFRYAGPPGVASSVADLGGRRVATSFLGLVRNDLSDKGIDAEVVRLDGAVETAVTLGVADVIADVVETGTTLRNAGLAVFGDPILQSEAVLIRPSGGGDNPAVDVLVRRLTGVLTARRYVMMDYDIRVELVEQACALTPGLESPTVSPLHDRGYVAVRAMVPRSRTNQVMDELYEVGARAILVTEIAACRL
ncbi:ATP phosphoribosyltransferase [Calidifontibacter sp. DB0510]|uniref:ATP phosphoribosyltransferase n=1 Tax=Metallococcus carri TaxID=1656884 RepID=A0A967E9A2_9MICO|nr:ATP phosphoribosyltransferase [Metallococcus carri]NHN54990.1 ATP phosphoribosyltransferase [Metallococcus carri]NOP37336.1 ATP phosphoribosyltransferase [Calidifontibacter sp. DB2511S]